MPRTGPTLCHPKIGYVDPSVTPLSTHKLPIHRWSTLMEITLILPQIPDTKLKVISKVQFLQLRHIFRQKYKKHNPSHVRRHTLPSQYLMTPFRLNTNKPKLHEFAAPKPNHIPCCNKNLFIKTPFDLRHLTSSSFYLNLPLNLSEGTNNTKRGNTST